MLFSGVRCLLANHRGAAAAAAAAAPRSPRRMDTSSSDGGTLELEAALRLTHLLIAPWRPNREGAMVDASRLFVWGCVMFSF